jgi:antitoxin component of RelBE/YafQ-DinJ toxin-antitoxin module
MTTLTLRLDSSLKEETILLAKKLWLSLNQLINLKLREFVSNGSININLFENDSNLIEVNESAEDVLAYLNKSIK